MYAHHPSSFARPLGEISASVDLTSYLQNDRTGVCPITLVGIVWYCTVPDCKFPPSPLGAAKISENQGGEIFGPFQTLSFGRLKVR